MVITVKLFGPLRREIGQEALPVTIDDDRATCAGLRAKLSQCQPRLATMLPACRFAVNRQFASEDQPIRPDDEIALVGLVSGG